MTKKHEINWVKVSEDGKRSDNLHPDILGPNDTLVNFTTYYNITEFSISLTGTYSVFNMYSVDTLDNSKKLCGIKVEVNLKDKPESFYVRRIGNKVIVCSDKIEESPLFEKAQKQSIKGQKKAVFFLYPSGRIKWRTE